MECGDGGVVDVFTADYAEPIMTRIALASFG
jgi:hypothetical protein